MSDFYCVGWQNIQIVCQSYGNILKAMLNSRTSQLAKMLGLKFGLYNHSQCDSSRCYYLDSARFSVWM